AAPDRLARVVDGREALDTLAGRVDRRDVVTRLPQGTRDVAEPDRRNGVGGRDVDVQRLRAADERALHAGPKSLIRPPSESSTGNRLRMACAYGRAASGGQVRRA